jgi:hypothetical protein
VVTPSKPSLSSTKTPKSIKLTVASRKTPAAKTAGKKTTPAAAMALSDSDGEGKPRKKKGGRSAGSPNFSDNDRAVFLQLAREILPDGSSLWNEVTKRYNLVMKERKRPERLAKSIRDQFYKVSLNFTSLIMIQLTAYSSLSTSRNLLEIRTAPQQSERPRGSTG